MTEPPDCLGVVGKCTDCENPVLEYLCNQSLLEVRPESKNFDYWFSCSNILCKNHSGGGSYGYYYDDWVDVK
jgi:hypothetical protein